MKRVFLLFIGITFALFCLEILLQTSSFVLTYTNKIINYQKIKNKIKAKDNNSVKILCVGESTTFAQYTTFLSSFLNKKTDKIFVAIDCGIPGTNIKNIATRINEQIDLYHPDIVVTMIGINDALFNEKKIYKQYPIKILNLFILLKKNIENIVVSKLYAQSDVKTDYQRIADNYFDTGEGLEQLIYIANKNPKDKEVIKLLIYTYKMKFNHLQVEKYAKLFLQYDSLDPSVLFMLTDSYIKQKKFKDAYNLISNVINNNEINIDSRNKYLSNLSESFICYSSLDDIRNFYDIITENRVETSILDNLYDYLKANNIDVKHYNYYNRYKNIVIQPNFNTDEIKQAYLYIAQQIINKDVAYICMGYPTIPIEDFKQFFEGTALLNKIYFVSNENNFKEALKHHSFYQVFRDNFAGSFGHCTDYGNELIAKNLAQTIIKLVE